VPPVDVGWAALAGFAAGYVMALAATWLEGVFGIPRLDFGHTGYRYVGGEKPGAWYVGITFHLVDSVLLALLYAVAVYPRIAHGSIAAGILTGLAYGVVLWLILAMLVVMPLMGSGPFGSRTGSWKPAAASLLIHLIFGTILGGVYVPPI
jgi:hypothetical protein